MVPQAPTVPTNPFHVETLEDFKENLSREAEAIKTVETVIERLISQGAPGLGELVGPDGKPLKDQVAEVQRSLTELLFNYLSMPSLLEMLATPDAADTGSSIASYVVSYMFYNEFARLLQALFPEFTPHVTKVPLVALIELSNPTEKTLLDAFTKRFSITVRDSDSNAIIMGDKQKLYQEQRLRLLVGHTVDFLAMKGMLVTVSEAPDTPKQVRLTPAGLRLLEHLKSMEFKVRAMHEAHTRLGLQGTTIREGV